MDAAIVFSNDSDLRYPLIEARKQVPLGSLFVLYHPAPRGPGFLLLDQPPRLDVSPPIENKTDVDNQTPNQHGIAGYLNDPVVARRIHDALIG